VRIKQFNRYELKYVLTRPQYERAVETLRSYLNPDPMGDQYGRYTITSLYYDTVDYQAYWDKIEGHKFRRKVRIRVYGEQTITSETACFAEIKQRINKTLQKKRVILPYTTAEALCGSGEPVAGKSEADQAVIEEIQYLQGTLQLQPACIVKYDRLALSGSDYDPGLRVTFDTNLQGRIYDLSLLSQGYTQNHFFMPPQWCIMEVKVNYRVPYWLTELIGQERLTLRRISKYCTALEQSKAALERQQILY